MAGSVFFGIFGPGGHSIEGGMEAGEDGVGEDRLEYRPVVARAVARRGYAAGMHLQLCRGKKKEKFTLAHGSICICHRKNHFDFLKNLE